MSRNYFSSVPSHNFPICYHIFHISFGYMCCFTLCFFFFLQRIRRVITRRIYKKDDHSVVWKGNVFQSSPDTMMGIPNVYSRSKSTSPTANHMHTRNFWTLATIIINIVNPPHHYRHLWLAMEITFGKPNIYQNGYEQKTSLPPIVTQSSPGKDCGLLTHFHYSFLSFVKQQIFRDLTRGTTPRHYTTKTMALVLSMWHHFEVYYCSFMPLFQTC